VQALGGDGHQVLSDRLDERKTVALRHAVGDVLVEERPEPPFRVTWREAVGHHVRLSHLFEHRLDERLCDELLGDFASLVSVRATTGFSQQLFEAR
jgi:hypothetical protein